MCPRLSTGSSGGSGGPHFEVAAFADQFYREYDTSTTTLCPCCAHFGAPILDFDPETGSRGTECYAVFPASYETARSACRLPAR